MKNQSRNPLASAMKQVTLPTHFVNLLSYLIFFAFGLTFGIILTYNLKNFTFNLQVVHGQLLFSTSPPSPPLPPPPPPPSLATLKKVVPQPTSISRVGLKPFLMPSKLMHDMNDEELLWRASMTPKVQDFPFDRTPKVAFMFLTRGPVLLAPFWEMFFKGHNGLYSIYVHSDPSSNESLPENSVFYGRRIPSQKVEWGNVNMIEAERRLLANALLDFSNQRFVLLSEACIPLFNFSTIYNYLMNSSQSYVEAYDLNNSVGRGRYNRKMNPPVTIEQWRKGSQWFEVDRKLALEVVSDRTYFPVFQQYCRGPCYADEHYLPTFMSTKFWEDNSNRSLTWVDWSKGGPHPAKFTRTDVTVEFLEKLRTGKKCWYNGEETNVCFLFARKFTTNALERLMRFGPKVMQFNK